MPSPRGKCPMNTARLSNQGKRRHLEGHWPSHLVLIKDNTWMRKRILSQISQYAEDPTVEHLRTPRQRNQLPKRSYFQGRDRCSPPSGDHY
ncbi:hypothetical protein Pmani_011169 [Petrolisthes manimaculis]|uniref:Uncharacterized protein n=1 Tax=Petrolisthes manimaculis TaxID=1843537 RepID=A0AAE1Q193_9EUCA|nr:hypothetical protein Pmani_011169 [Petrolisthes manimaculis]